ncbi:nuclear transport factor 2 family protein [Actinopolyspora erythraea]|uniref:hypothetical protein n=1 Tax=Actinopolyspora erythraea TaxID=414996 RepID=UPI00069443D0|nr:hypothetical protein [Actinopolyspora erythraea]
MTYPPQNPGPNDPWQQQNWGQQGGYPGGHYPDSGQQPAWGQQPGGQYPQSGGQPGWGQQYGQPDPYGQQPGGQHPPTAWDPQAWGQQPAGHHPQQGWGQQQAWEQPQPGVPGGYPPQQQKSKLPWILGGTGGGLLVLGGLAVLLFVVLGGPGDPKDTAQKYVNSINDKDFAAVASMTCEQNRGTENSNVSRFKKDNFIEEMKKGGLSEERARKIYEGLSFDMKAGEVREKSDTTAVAHLTGSMTIDTGVPGLPTKNQEFDHEFDMIVENGEWKMCDGADSSTG